MPAIRAAIGIEALVWLTDVGKLSRAEAVATMRWSARALLRSALEDLTTRPQNLQGWLITPDHQAGLHAW